MRTTLKLTEIVDEWILEIDAMPTTKSDYHRKIKLWFRWLATIDVDPREPQRIHVLQYKSYLQKQGKSVFTIDSYLTVVKLFYGYCAERKYYSNIGEGIKSTLKQHGHYKHPLTSVQAAMLMNSIDTSRITGKRDKLIIAMMLTNGLRACEVERIDICDFDKEGSQTILRVQRKGRIDKRETIAVPEIVDELLEEYVSCRDFDLHDPLIINHGYGAHGERLTKATICRIVKRRLRAAGIDDPKISAHSLRHTCGSLLVESGVSVEMIRDILGHTNSRTTRIYIDMAQHRKIITENPSRFIDRIIRNGEKRKQSPE